MTLYEIRSRICDIRCELEELADNANDLWAESEDEEISEQANDLCYSLNDIAGELAELENKPED